MKVAVNIVIDVDPDGYRADYLENFSNEEIREEMKNRAVDGTNWELRHYDWFRGAKLRGE